MLCRVKTSGVGVSMVRQPVLKYDSICAVGSSSNHFDDGVYRYNLLFRRHRQPHLFPNARTCANTLAAVIHKERKNHMCATNTNIAKDTTKAWHKDANLVNYNSKWQALDESAAKYHCNETKQKKIYGKRLCVEMRNENWGQTKIIK